MQGEVAILQRQGENHRDATAAVAAAMGDATPPPPPPPPEPAEVASTEVATSEAAKAPKATEIPATPEGAETAKDTPKKKKSARRGDPTLGQNRELRKREVKSYRGYGPSSVREISAKWTLPLSRITPSAPVDAIRSMNSSTA